MVHRVYSLGSFCRVSWGCAGFWDSAPLRGSGLRYLQEDSFGDCWCSGQVVGTLV